MRQNRQFCMVVSFRKRNRIWLFDVVKLQFSVERAPADAELFGGAAPVAAAFVQRAFDEDAFVLLQVAGRRGEDVARDAWRGGFADVHGDDL